MIIHIEKPSVTEVRKTLLLNELKDDGNALIAAKDSPTALVSLRMEIEDEQ